MRKENPRFFEKKSHWFEFEAIIGEAHEELGYADKSVYFRLPVSTAREGRDLIRQLHPGAWVIWHRRLDMERRETKPRHWGRTY